MSWLHTFRPSREQLLSGRGRFSFLLDSSVALFSTSKGRSSSRGLAPILRKIMAIAIAFGVFASNHFCPTRLNVSYDPTRSQDLRKSVPHAPVYQDIDLDGLYKLAELPRLKRWTSNWVILVLGLSRRRSFVIPELSFIQLAPKTAFFAHLSPPGHLGL